MVEPKVVSHPAAAIWANAICHKDAATIFANSAESVASTVEEVADEISLLADTCTGSRFVGVVQTKHGPEYFFALMMGDHEVWYGLTVMNDKVISVE